MKVFSSIIIFSLFSISIFASQTMVSSASDINGGFWFPGDTIVMTNGEWNNQTISFKAIGEAEKPVVLMAETPGQVILNGTSSLAFSGEYIHVTGLYFKEGVLGNASVISFRTSSSNLAVNCRVSNTTIESYNPSDNTKDTKWVAIYGLNNTVDHCSFTNKNNSGTLLVVWIGYGVPNHTIEYNYFGYRIPNVDSSGKELNGQEIIRIGDSSTSLRNARCKISNNFFERCNGEIEIISNKSCENEYTNNVFYECVGMLTIRHGNRCLVNGNYFFGNGISNTGGVRIIGEDHTVYNNYFENLRGNNWRAALCMVRGKENSALNDYAQVKNANVMFNTMVNCKQAFCINYNSSSSYKMTPIGSTIANNHVYNTTTQNTKVYMSQVAVADVDVTWKNNLMNMGDYYGFYPTNEEVIEDIDPSMTLAGTYIDMYEPAFNSALANYTTNDFSDITSDIRGRDRGALKIPGTSQLSGTVTLEMPTRQSTGADYYVSTPIRKVYNTIDLKAYSLNNDIWIMISEPGSLSVFDISGKLLTHKNMDRGLNSIPVSQNGVMLLSFVGKSGVRGSQKMMHGR